MINVKIGADEIAFFKKKVKEKIQAEGWALQGRNAEVKEANFLRCWLSEEAFKKLLIRRGVWFRTRGLYVGDAQGAGVDFQVNQDKKVLGVGIRSIDEASYLVYRSVAYPNDRFESEKDKIADLIVACTVKEDAVHFIGAIKKEVFLAALEKADKRYSRRNQECFRTVSLSLFSLDCLEDFLSKCRE